MLAETPQQAGVVSTFQSFKQLVRSGPTGYLALPFVLVGYLIVALLLLITVLKISAPGEVGLWVYYIDGVRHFSGGIMTDNQPGKEVLGWWLVVVPIFAAWSLHKTLSTTTRFITRQKPGK